jgi:hypothetical protein
VIAIQHVVMESATVMLENGSTHAHETAHKSVATSAVTIPVGRTLSLARGTARKT